MNNTLKESFPFLTDQERKSFGLIIASYGIKRVGRKIIEDGFSVNVYNASDKKIIEDLFRKFIGNEPLRKKVKEFEFHHGLTESLTND